MLVVEDEPNIRDLVCLHLGLEGYACEGAGNGQAALQRTESDAFDLLVIDVMLPGLDGVSLCRAVRNGRANRDVPILMLTARRDETDKVVGLESGADDYLTKPFGVRELVARARALLRRPRRAAAAAQANADVDGGGDDAPILIHGIDIDPARRRGSSISTPCTRTTPSSAAGASACTSLRRGRRSSARARATSSRTPNGLVR